VTEDVEADREQQRCGGKGRGLDVRHGKEVVREEGGEKGVRQARERHGGGQAPNQRRRRHDGCLLRVCMCDF
jgi:hypothetical protein